MAASQLQQEVILFSCLCKTTRNVKPDDVMLNTLGAWARLVMPSVAVNGAVKCLQGHTCHMTLPRIYTLSF